MILNEFKKEIIRIFMEEAKQKHVGPRSGTKSTLVEAIGLVEVCVAFESFINELLYSKSIKEKRINFSNKYQKTFQEHKKCLENYIEPLKKELENEPLKNMTPESRKTIKITDSNNLEGIIEVVYRVRSNLIHGSKTLNLRRDKLLIENTFHFLYTLLEIIFVEENIL
jgi:hypothetical protein